MEEIKILSLEKKPRSKKYKVVTLTDSFTFSEDTIIKYMIFKDKVFEQKEWNKILEDAITDEYFNKVLNYLGSSYKSIYEIRKYLHDKSKKNNIKLNEKQIEDIIHRVRSLGYLNDEMLAKNICDYYFRSNKGPLFIKAKLSEKKVDEQTIDLALLSYTEEMQEEAITRVLTKEKNEKYPLKKYKLMLTSKLIQNGFSKHVIERVLSSWTFEDKSEDLIVKDYDKIIRKMEKKEFTNYERKQYVINSLLNKGYDYQTINEYLKNIE